MSDDLFSRILHMGILNEIEEPEEAPDEYGPRFRGANTPLLIDGEFVTDGEAHCPRVAILRKRGVQAKPKPKNILSWQYGRAWESLMKRLIDRAEIPNLSYQEEEDCAVLIRDQEDRVIYSARPDLVVTYNNIKFAVECKTSQSNNVALDVFQHHKPKLGAFLQLAMAMGAHNLTQGYTIYGLMHWIRGYDFQAKNHFKLEPDFVTHATTVGENGCLCCNGRQTIVSYDRCVDGIHALRQMDLEGVFVPERPKQMNLFGDKSKYNICTYCSYNVVCSQYLPSEGEIDIEEFMMEVLSEVDCYDKRDVTACQKA